MDTFTVVGLYMDQDPPQRFAEAYVAESAEAAEAVALEEHPDGDLVIAGSIKGDHSVF
jgi:hypothetical protein